MRGPVACGRSRREGPITIRPGGLNISATIRLNSEKSANALSQSIGGLSLGQTYILSFDYAAAQFRNAAGSNWFGASDSGWQVSLGTQSQTTPTLNIASQGFSGWQSETMTFTATAVSETLSFLAVGGPSGVSPVALRDGVSLDAAPEPSAVSLLATALAGIGLLCARRRRRTH